MKTYSEPMLELLRASGSQDPQVAIAAQYELVKAFAPVLKKGVLKGDIIGDIYEHVFFPPGVAPEFPLDLVAPGNEKDFVAYTISNHGRIPERTVAGDYVMVPTYVVGSSIDYLLRYARDARWDIVRRAMQVLEASFIRKNNNDGWKVIVTAGKNRGIMVYDSLATSGLFTKRLVALAKTVMRRNAGGNSTSIDQGKLTDLYMSPEALEDIRTWDLTQVDDFTRREIFMQNVGNGEYSITQIFGVKLHDIDEFGVGQEYQNYYLNTLGGILPSGKVELVVGLDLSKDDCFVRPVRQELQVFPDPYLHRQLREGFYGFLEAGWACLDSRRIILLSD